MVLTTDVSPGVTGQFSRRGLLAASALTAAGALAPRAVASRGLEERRRATDVEPAAHHFLSRPDLLPPPIEILASGAGQAKGHILLAPFSFPTTPPSTEASGPLIVDRLGQPLWFAPRTKVTAMDLRVQRYRGAPVLTWWEGTVFGGYGGTFVVADSSYDEITRIRARNGYKADLHDVLITAANTALITIYNEIRADLTSIGGAVNGRLVEGIVQEIDIGSGRVVFEWHSFDHVALDESFDVSVQPAGNVDYFHLNSIGVDADGHLLVSARNTSAVYKIHRRTGAVIWRLGGTRSDFVLGPGASFAFQHDARRRADGTITIFDNAAGRPTDSGIPSRVLRLRVDTGSKTATLVRDYQAGEIRTAWAMGNAQQVADGGLFVGWGTYPGFSEIGPDGSVRFDARFAGTSVTYRARREEWVGRPKTRPTIAARRLADGSTRVYASWNGATEVARWQVRAGSSATDLLPLRRVTRRGFETTIDLRSRPRYVAAAALDRRGAVLGMSKPVRT